MARSASAAPLSPEMSVDDWAALDEDEPGELVDGYLEEEEVPQNDHETVVVWLVSMLVAWASPRGGFVFGSEAKFAVRPKRGRKPDVSMYLPGGHRPRRRGVNRVPPDVMIEVITPTPRDVRRDRIAKADDYSAFGVRWYWLVDPDARVLEIWELEASGRYARALAASAGAIAVPGCAELTLDLDGLWAELDRLGPDEPDDSEQEA